MTIASKMATLFRGDVPLGDLPREFLRRRRAAGHRERERREVDALKSIPARLTDEFRALTDAELLRHLKSRPYAFFAISEQPKPAAFADAIFRYFPDEIDRLKNAANKIVDQETWELAGFGEVRFDTENVWRSDPFTHEDWGLDYHADVIVYRAGGPDIRVLWELNRLGHLVALALAYQVTGDERLAETYFQHIDDWMQQNPYGRGANWNCAMEAALRAINVLAAFDILRRSAACNEKRLARLLQFADEHGRFIFDNNEFSYVGTSNHYLSDVVGLFWIGTMLPELEQAREWREIGRGEMLKETEKQVLPDGADFEVSTGYHNFVTEMLLYSRLLATRNGVDMPAVFSGTVRKMLLFINGIVRPDGRVPLIGDADGSQIVPMVRRDADDQAYLLSLGTVILKDAELKEFAKTSPELFWLLGEKGIENFAAVAPPKTRAGSKAFPNIGAYVMRDGDLYLHINTGDIGARGRGSHSHNDKLGIEISAGEQAFIVDPGSYVYNLDRAERHRFRSTAYHSTVMIDGVEQNTTNADLPFIMGNEARPVVLSWETDETRDSLAAEHYGYKRLADPVTHRRTITFEKADKYWLVEDGFTGRGKHLYSSALHLAPGITCEPVDGDTVKLTASDSGTSLLIRRLGPPGDRQIEPAYISRSYGHREPSSILRWDVTATAPLTTHLIIVPVLAHEKLGDRLELLRTLTDNIS
jgi:uncharacterized heparinase superfamily protein